MKKLSHDKIAEVIADAAAALRKITAERDEALAKLAGIERRQEAEKVARAMQEKGLNNGPIDQLISDLEKMAETGKLQDVKNAVELVGPDMAAKLATINNDIPRNGGVSELETFILSGN